MAPYQPLIKKLFPTTTTSDQFAFLELLLRCGDSWDSNNTSFDNPARELIARLEAVAPNHPAIGKIKSLLGSQAD